MEHSCRNLLPALYPIAAYYTASQSEPGYSHACSLPITPLIHPTPRPRPVGMTKTSVSPAYLLVAFTPFSRKPTFYPLPQAGWHSSLVSVQPADQSTVRIRTATVSLETTARLCLKPSWVGRRLPCSRSLFVVDPNKTRNQTTGYSSRRCEHPPTTPMLTHPPYPSHPTIAQQSHPSTNSNR